MRSQAQHEAARPDDSVAEAAGHGAELGKERQTGGNEPNQSVEADAPGSSQARGAGAAHQSGAEAQEHAADLPPADAQHSRAAASGAEAGAGKGDAIQDGAARKGTVGASTQVVHGSIEASASASTEGDAEDVAAVLADAVHALEQAQDVQQPDQGTQAHGTGRAPAVAHSWVPAAVLNRLSKLTEVRPVLPLTGP